MGYSASPCGFRHFLDDVLNDFSDFFPLMLFFVVRLEYESEAGRKMDGKARKIVEYFALSDLNCKFHWYTWSQFIDLISNRIIVNGSERSKVLSASTLRLLITQEEIHFCSLEHDGGGASAAAQKFMPFSVFLLSMARCRIALLARFFSGSFEDKVNIQINWYFSCFSVGSEEAFDFFS